MEEVIGADGIPPVHVMMELISVFMIHFGSQFPCIDRRDLEAKVHARTGSSFLLNCIAGIAARSVPAPNRCVLRTVLTWADSRHIQQLLYLHSNHGSMGMCLSPVRNRCSGLCSRSRRARLSLPSSSWHTVVSPMTQNRRSG
jgi:hypothetical protein